MIVNTGQRTDIPAFYADWFLHRLQEGFVDVRNPYYPRLVTRYRLHPSVVDVLGFCTKNPRPLLRHFEALKRYGQFWYVTLTPYGKDLEPFVPRKEEVLKDIEFLSSRLGKEAVGWRYTPILVNETYTVERHIAFFEQVAKRLEGKVRLVAFGFLDLYPKLAKLHPELRDCPDEDKIRLAKAFSEIARRHGLTLRLCSKEKWLQEYGIDVEGCMRLEDYEAAIGHKMKPTKKMQARQGYCSCFLSADIGAYSSCLHLCAYCYANGPQEEVRRNAASHDDASSFLLGGPLPEDERRQAKQESWIADEPLTLFDL